MEAANDDLMSAIKRIIRVHGPITVAQYMELALQHPEMGYYRRGNPIGRAGDFVTAPEISQMFGELIGLWAADMWRQMGSPSPFVLCELGPGRGTLMQDALRATEKVEGFHKALRLHLCESSPGLLAMQQEGLAAFRPVWIPDPTALPVLPAIVIANEFFDALPIRQLERAPGGWCERLIGMDDLGLGFILTRPDTGVAQLLPDHARLAITGSVVEINPQAYRIMRQLAAHVAKHGGAVIAIDYGYIRMPLRGTIQAVRAHEKVPLLEHPGEADLSAQVDFSALQEAIVMEGLKVHGPSGQGEFLRSLGIETRAQKLADTTPEKKDDILTALHRLIDDDKMGELFKVIVGAPPALKPAGFE